MAADRDSIIAAPTHCDHCKKVSSSNLKIRACTRCFAVGYCSKNCQRAEWKKHKLTCNPRTIANDKKPSSSPRATSDQEDVIDINSDDVRLETQYENGTWQDVGPINLLKNMSAQHVHTNSSSSSLRRKELSLATKQILGQTANSFIFRHSCDGIDENLVIFLHGAGDTHVPFDKLGQTMELPQTATLSLSASMKMNLSDLSLKSNSTFVELPFRLGFTWFEEMDYQVTGDTLPNDHPHRLQSLGNAVSAINMLLSSLTDHSNDKASYWLPERVFLFGFSAGACLAMEACRLWKLRCHVPLGGAICIGGGIKTDSLPRCVSANNNGSDAQYQFTDVLIITGSKDDVYSQKDAQKSKSCYDASKVQIHVQQGKGHDMIGSREEMQTVMKFLSKRLVRRMPSMEDMSER